MLNNINKKQPDLSNYYYIKLIIILFILSRILYYFAGLKMEVYLDAWQFFPDEFLKNDLLKSTFFSFSQPPLFNIFTGFTLKLSNYISNGSYNYYVVFWRYTFLIFGLLSSIGLYRLCDLLFLNKKKSFYITLIFMVLPTTLLFENHGYKDYLTFCFLILLIYLSINIIINDKYLDYIFISILIVLLCLWRETFHIFWAYLFAAYEFYLNRRKKSLIIFIFITFLVLPFYIKNLVLHDKFAVGGWMYENLTQKTQYVRKIDKGMYPKLKNILFKNDENFEEFKSKLSPIWDKSTFMPPKEYKQFIEYTYTYNHPLLLSETFHNEIMIEVDNIRKKDFYLYLKEYPQVFVVTVANSFFRHFFNSPDVFLYYRNNSKEIPVLIRLTHCLKLTYLCFKSEDINQRGVEDNTSFNGKPYHLLNNKEKIFFSLQQINFLLVFIFIYLFLLFFLNVNKMFTSRDKNEKLMAFWLLIIFLKLVILILFEETEIPRNRFPYEYISIILVLYFSKLKKLRSLFRPNS